MPRTRSKQTVAILEMLACAFLWSIAGIFIKQIPWNALAIAGFRSLIAGTVTFAYLKLKRIPFRITKNIVIGGLMMCITFFAFVGANKLTTAANAIVLQFTEPVFLMVFSSVIYKKRFALSDIVAAGGTMVGISLFFFDQLSGGHLLGNIVGVVSGAFMAGMYLAIGMNNKNDRVSAAVLGHLFTAVIGIPFFFAFPPAEVSARAVISLLVLGVLQLGVPYILLLLAVEDCPLLACSLLSAVEPLLNPMWVFIFDGERPGVFALIGGVVVIATVTAWCIYKNKKKEFSSDRDELTSN